MSNQTRTKAIREVKNRTEIFVTDNLHLACLIKGKLEAANINTILLNQKDSSYQNFGVIRLLVLNESVELAKNIIANQDE